MKQCKSIFKNKICQEKLKRKSFTLDLWYQQHYNVIVEITDTNNGLLSKPFFKKPRQHGGCTKPLGNHGRTWGNDKFV